MDQVANLLDRPRRYYNIDGLGELGMSVMCLGSALVLWLVVRWPANSVWHQLAWVIFIGLMLAIRYGTQAIKTRVTYPRTGYLEYRKRPGSTLTAMALGALVPVGMVVAFRQHWDVTALAIPAGLAFAAAYAYGVARAVPWKRGVTFALVLGAVGIGFVSDKRLAALAGGSLLAGTIVLCLLLGGAVLLISGSASFWLYLRHTREPAQEAR